MTQLNTLVSNETKTMTLKEITDLLNVRHDKAMIKVAEMAKDPEFGQVSILDISYSKGNGATGTTETYQLDKRQSLAVAARLNTALLMRIIDRWEELETAVAKLPEETKISIGLSREHVLVPAWERERDLYIAKIEADHAISMLDIAQRRAALEQREYVLVDGVQIKADMVASKASLPVVTITSIMQGTKYDAAQANQALYRLGLLERSNTRQQNWVVTSKGSFYGRNVASSKNAQTTIARWFEGETEAIQKMVTEYYK